MKFLEKIRQSSHQVKVRWLIFLSILSMIVLIYVWGAYFDFTVRNRLNHQDVSNQESFTQKLKIGGAFAFDLLKNTFSFLKDSLMSPKEYLIK
jgi:heme/copper-type cytochrome/quinol oxidase subunit 2